MFTCLIQFLKRKKKMIWVINFQSNKKFQSQTRKEKLKTFKYSFECSQKIGKCIIRANEVDGSP